MSENKIEKDLVVKSNRLNSAAQNLSLSEMRIVQLGIVDARETGCGLDPSEPLKIDAIRYAEAFGVSRQTAYEVILDAERNLFERKFTFLDERDGNPVKTRWISQIKYLRQEGAIELIFTPAVIHEITRIDGFEQFFTKYMLEQTAEMGSMYAVRLYELLVQWKKAKKTPLFELELIREQLGVAVNEYKLMSDFKRRVLHKAIDEINKKSDLKVTYTQEKNGKKILGFKFTVLFKNNKKSQKPTENIDTFNALSQKQIDYFANLLANDSGFSRHAAIGESAGDFCQRIKIELTNPAKQREWADDLKRLGFKI